MLVALLVPTAPVVGNLEVVSLPHPGKAERSRELVRTSDCRGRTCWHFGPGASTCPSLGQRRAQPAERTPCAGLFSRSVNSFPPVAASRTPASRVVHYRVLGGEDDTWLPSAPVARLRQSHRLRWNMLGDRSMYLLARGHAVSRRADLSSLQHDPVACSMLQTSARKYSLAVQQSTARPSHVRIPISTCALTVLLLSVFRVQPM